MESVMIMTEVIQSIEKLIAFAIILQTIEFFQIRASFSDSGVWRWRDLKKEFQIFSRPVYRVISFLLEYKNFLIILALRLLLAFLLMFQGNFFVIFVLLVLTILINFRWRGTFNGGSDYMTVLVLLCLTVQSFFSDSEKVSVGVILYLTIQLISSYFIAGLVKIKNANWRNGKALMGFVSSTIYNENQLTLLLKRKEIAFLSSWVIIVFELSFPLALLNTKACTAYIAMAVLFHIGNFYIFGLNRFIFAWLACYPALYFCSKIFSALTS